MKARMFQFKLLRVTNRIMFLCVAMFIHTNVHAGGVPGDQASEHTQLLNWWQLTAQYSAQAAELMNQINTLDLAIRNSAQNPLGLLPESEMTASLLGSLNNLQEIGNTMDEIDARWSHAYLDPPDGRTSSKYKIANDKNFAAAKGALQSILQQQANFKKSSQAIDNLKRQLRTTSGTNGYLGVLSQAVLTATDIAGATLTTLQSQSSTLATYVAGESSKDQTSRDINSNLTSFVKEDRVLTKKQLKLSDYISKPDVGITGN